MELVLLGLLAASLVAVMWWDGFSQRAHVARLQREWSDARSVDFGPVGVIVHGDRPSGNVPNRFFGAIGIVDGGFVLVGQRVDQYDVDLPLAAVRWVGLRTNIIPKGRRMVEQRVLVIHLETAFGWRVYACTEGQPEAFAQALATAAGLPLHDVGTGYEDYGPVYAAWLARDAAGGWQVVAGDDLNLDDPPPEWDSYSNTLYLAPDRLLYDWEHPILVSDILSVEVYPQGHALNPFTEDLLQIVHTTAPGLTQSAGFLVRDAADWADEIEGKRSE
jgi:hypothetical protein